jgi:hypothetical protein
MENEETKVAPETEAPPSNQAVEPDYFGEHAEMIDDDGNPVSETKAPEKKPEATPAAKEAPKKEGDDTPPAIKDVPEDFTGRFYEKDEQGAVNFKGEDAMGFLFPEKETQTSFRYTPLSVKPNSMAPAPAPDEPPAWKKEMEAERNYGKTLRENLLSPLKYIREFATGNPNATYEQALQYAEQKSLQQLEEHLAERKWENDVKRRETIEKEGRTAAEKAAIKERAGINEALFVDEVGGSDAWNKLIFGYRSKDGKMQKGLAGDDLLMLFEIAHPEVRGRELTEKEYNDKLHSFYYGLAADRQKISWFYNNVVKGSLFKHLRPHVVDKIRNTKRTQDKQNREGNLRRPGPKGGPKNQTISGDEQTLQQFLDPAAERDVAAV